MITRIAIVDDNTQIRKRLHQRFQFFEDIRIVLEAPSADFFMDRLQHLHPEERPHIVLMDIEMPGTGGIEATSRIKDRYPDIEIIIQTVFEDEEKIFRAIQAGATGYLLKDDKIELYLKAIQEIRQGGAPISPSIARKILGYMKAHPVIETAAGKDFDDHLPELSKREHEILTFLVKDVQENEIASTLFLSPHTVHTHIKNIYRKLQVKSRASLVKKVMEQRLV